MTAEKSPTPNRRKGFMEGMWENRLLLAIGPAVFVLIGVILGAFLNYKFGIKSQLRVSDHQKRQQVFSELMGIKFVITQLYVSRFEASVFSDYHESKWKQAGYPRDSIDLQEAQRWMHKSEDLAAEIAKNNQYLFEKIGMIGWHWGLPSLLNAATGKINWVGRSLFRNLGILSGADSR
jgi:hypothetical protein